MNSEIYVTKGIRNEERTTKIETARDEQQYLSVDEIFIIM